MERNRESFTKFSFYVDLIVNYYDMIYYEIILISHRRK